MPKTIFYLLKGDYTSLRVPDGPSIGHQIRYTNDFWYLRPYCLGAKILDSLDLQNNIHGFVCGFAGCCMQLASDMVEHADSRTSLRGDQCSRV